MLYDEVYNYDTEQIIFYSNGTIYYGSEMNWSGCKEYIDGGYIGIGSNYLIGPYGSNKFFCISISGAI